ncbi:MAG: hypothetical protein J6B25_02510 [Clostridia bacterium]|nr:hypothetical protein [Clostridia bacterium]
MKKLLAILMALAILLSFAACGGNENPDTTQPTETTTEAPKFDETVVTDGKTNKLTIRTPIDEFTFNEANTEGNFLAQTNIVKCGTLENAEVNIGVAFAVTHAAYDSVHDYVTKSFKNHTIFEEGKIGDYTTYIRQNGPSAMQIIVCFNNFEFAMLEFKLPEGAKRDDYAALRAGELFKTVYDNLTIEVGAAEVENTDAGEPEAPANGPITTDKGFVTVTPAGGFIYDEAQSDNKSLTFTNTSLGANAAVYVYDEQSMEYEVQKKQFAYAYPNKEYTSVTIGANTFEAIESNTGVTYLVAKTSTGNAMYVMVWNCSVADATPLIETIVIN